MSSTPTTTTGFCPNFSDLRELHKCANDLLLSPQVQQCLVQHQEEVIIRSSLREISEASLKLLDLCGTTKDVLLLVKDHLQELGHTFRRARAKKNINGPGPGSDFEARIETHALYRKKLKKEVSKCLRDLKGMKDKYFALDLSQIDQTLIVVVHVLREVRGATISTAESLLTLISLPMTISITHSKTQKSSSFASKLIPIMRCQRLLERCDSMEVRMANKRLEQVESAMEVLEMELECIIRRLIHTRVLLLNILDSY